LEESRDYVVKTEIGREREKKKEGKKKI